MNDTESLYEELAADVGDLVQGWTTYRAISLTREYAQVLNGLNPSFAGLIQAALRSYSVSVMCRLIDPLGSGDRKTAGFEALLSTCDEDFQAELKPRLDESREAAAKITRFRNKRVAHSDFGIVTGSTPRDSFTFEDFDRALVQVIDLTNEFERRSERDEIPYGNSDGIYDLRDVIAKLKRGG